MHSRVQPVSISEHGSLEQKVESILEHLTKMEGRLEEMREGGREESQRRSASRGAAPATS